MTLAINARVGGLPSLPSDGDAFLKKAGEWAFATTFPAPKEVVEEIYGRFAIAPVDAVAMNYLESRVAALNCLPVGHLYDGALEALAKQLQGTQVGEILKNDVTMRNYFVARKAEQIFS